jgi:caffeoyl-CoA O-methyltransferase
MTTRRELLGTAAVAAAMLPGTAHGQRGGGGRGNSTAAQGPPLARDDAERRALDVLDDIAARQSFYNVTREDGRLLRLLAQSTGARRVVEIGTSTGYSGIWLALAMRATGGEVTTFEIDRGRAATAAANFERAGVAKQIRVVVGDAHVEVPKVEGTLDLVFIDADKDGYVAYLRSLLPKLRPGGLIIADNMQVPAPDPRYVQAVTTDPGLETLFLNMHATGLGVTLKKA